MSPKTIGCAHRKLKITDLEIWYFLRQRWTLQYRLTHTVHYIILLLAPSAPTYDHYKICLPTRHGRISMYKGINLPMTKTPLIFQSAMAVSSVLLSVPFHNTDYLKL
jgi:hypothetical protein